MGLEEYHKKRDFTRTEEPKGQTGPHPKKSLFVVQKHAATRLHYDLRLELDGVLKSWAVPKGPSLDPAEKRLAVHVEDHPLAYGSFEGTIPKEEYGGGTVMVWDRGTWQCLGDPQQSYEKGKLQFTLHGQKLRGRWTLARMGGKQVDQGENWLLIKGKDQYAVSENSSILQDHPNSVMTGRTMKEITRKQKTKATASSSAIKGTDMDPSRLKNAQKTPMPTYFEPQLATLVKNAPRGNEWLHEIKYDGYRILAFIDNDSVKLYSRNGKEWTHKFPSISKSLLSFPAQNAIIDGEIVALRQDGSMDFQALQNALKGKKQANLYYYIFDLPYYNDFDLSSSPLLQRKTLLRTCYDQMDQTRDRIRFTDHILGSGENVYKRACNMHLEGLVSKRTDSSYEQKRSKSWLKVKCMKRQEFVIGGYTEPSGSRMGFGALLLGYYKDDELIYSGKVGTGFSQKTIQDLLSGLKKMERDKPAYKDPPRGAAAKGVHWVEPERIVEIEFLEWTRENHLRQPSFKGLRQDKSAKSVTREWPKGEPRQHTPQRKKISKPSIRKSGITVAGIRITNPDKILFPDQGKSKQDLAYYYESIAEDILPHIRHRPLTLLRCPEGRKKECFYQKHRQDSFPEPLHSITIREKETSKDYVMVKDRKGLISLVQLGVLEIHPWGASKTNIESPDQLTFDLDPDPNLAWNEVIRGAKLLRERIEDLGLDVFIKTSGGKGLHLVIPLQRRNTWDEAKQFTQAMASDMARNHRYLCTATMTKSRRTGKIFIDFHRNSRGATSVAPYSTRAKPGAPVSTPVRWDELSPELTPDRYTLSNLSRRLAALKKDPWQDFFTIRQSITRKMQNELGLSSAKK